MILDCPVSIALVLETVLRFPVVNRSQPTLSSVVWVGPHRWAQDRVQSVNTSFLPGYSAWLRDGQVRPRPRSLSLVHVLGHSD